MNDISQASAVRILHRIIFQAILDEYYGDAGDALDARLWLIGERAVIADTFDIIIPILNQAALRRIKRYMNR